MSTSLKVVSMAFTFCASFSRWAIRWRMRDIFTYEQTSNKPGSTHYGCVMKCVLIELTLLSSLVPIGLVWVGGGEVEGGGGGGGGWANG